MTSNRTPTTHRPLLAVGTLSLALGLGAAPAPLAAQPGNPDLDQAIYFMGVMQQYYGLLESVHEVAESPQRTAILHMQKMREIHEDRGDKAAAAGALRKLVAEASDPTIRNAARMMLVDVLRETGRASEALEVIADGLAENTGPR